MADRNLIRRLCWSTLVLSMLAAASPLVARDVLAVGAASNAQVRRPANQGYPEAEARAVMSENERKIRDLRDQEIEQLKITLGRRQPVQRRADLYLRLAELYIEAYRFEFLVEGRVYEARLAQGAPAKGIDHGRSRPWLQLAIRASQEILDFKIPYERLDQVLYFLAYNHSELGDAASANRYYSELVRRFPTSSFAVEGLRELGEGAFIARDYRKAISYFEGARARSSQAPGFESQLPRIHHRLAWCQYRLKQHPKAVQEMKEAIRLAGAGGEKLLSVREEALRDLAIFMTETGDVVEAVSYFQKTVGDQQFYPRVLESLGRQYERNVEPIKATQVYESLLQTRPKDEAGFRVRVKLVDLDLRRGRYSQALERIIGAKLFASGQGDTETAWQNLRAMVRRTATENHEKYRKSSDRKALEVAGRFYEAYLDPLLVLADPRKEAPEIQMYLADVKREQGLSKEASALYRKVIDSSDKRYAKEAAALWTASLADAIRKESQASKTGVPGATEGAVREEATALEKEFVQAADDLNDSLKDTTEAREARLKAAQVLAAYPDSRRNALKRIRSLMEDSPRSEQAVTAARLWIQIFADQLTASEKQEKGGKESRKNAEEIQSAIADVRKYPEVFAFDQSRGGKLQAAIAEQESRLQVFGIASREKDRDYVGAARLYEKYAEEARDKTAVSKAFENAVASWLKADDLENADRVIQAWQKRLPDGKGAEQALRNLATLHFIRGRFDRSASLLERLAGTARDAQALELAARIIAAVPHDAPDALASAVGRFLQAFPQSPLRSRVLLLLAREQEARGMVATAIQTFKQCAAVGSAEDEPECAMGAARLSLGSGSREDARSQFKKLAAIPGKGSAAFFSAWARLELARIQDSEIPFPKLTREGLAAELPRRLQAFESVQKAYAPVLEAGGGFSVSASRRLGQVAMELASEMEAIASDDPKAQKVVETLRANAIQFFRQSQQKAVEGEWISPELPKLVVELGLAQRIAPAQGAFPVLVMMPFSAQGKSEESIEALRRQLSQNTGDAALWGRYALWLADTSKNDALASIALDRVLSIQPKSAAAINDLAVLKSRAGRLGIEDPWTATQVAALLKECEALEAGATTARTNRAQLLNFFALHQPARKIWEKIPAAARTPEVEDGLGVSLQGTGNSELAAQAFARAQEAGADPKRFARRFHQAATVSMKEPGECLGLLGGMNPPRGEFESFAAEKLEEACTSWKTRNTSQTN